MTMNPRRTTKELVAYAMVCSTRLPVSRPKSAAHGAIACLKLGLVRSVESGQRKSAPEGHRDNSPALQRWEKDEPRLSPVGTTEGLKRSRTRVARTFLSACQYPPRSCGEGATRPSRTQGPGAHDHLPIFRLDATGNRMYYRRNPRRTCPRGLECQLGGERPGQWFDSEGCPVQLRLGGEVDRKRRHNRTRQIARRKQEIKLRNRAEEHGQLVRVWMIKNQSAGAPSFRVLCGGWEAAPEYIRHHGVWAYALRG
jgi:hypothetical protein